MGLNFDDLSKQLGLVATRVGEHLSNDSDLLKSLLGKSESSTSGILDDMITTALGGRFAKIYKRHANKSTTALPATEKGSLQLEHFAKTLADTIFNEFDKADEDFSAATPDATLTQALLAAAQKAATKITEGFVNNASESFLGWVLSKISGVLNAALKLVLSLVQSLIYPLFGALKSMLGMSTTVEDTKEQESKDALAAAGKEVEALIGDYGLATDNDSLLDMLTRFIGGTPVASLDASNTQFDCLAKVLAKFDANHDVDSKENEEVITSAKSICATFNLATATPIIKMLDNKTEATALKDALAATRTAPTL